MTYTKLTPAVQERLCLLISNGILPETAVESEGLHPATYYRWKERGERALRMQERGEEPDPFDLQFIEFYRQVSAANAKMNGRLQQAIIKAAQEDWRASAYMLSKRMPKQFGEKTTVEVETSKTGKGRALSPEVAAEIRKKILFGDHVPRPPVAGGKQP